MTRATAPNQAATISIYTYTPGIGTNRPISLMARTLDSDSRGTGSIPVLAFFFFCAPAPSAT